MEQTLRQQMKTAFNLHQQKVDKLREQMNKAETPFDGNQCLNKIAIHLAAMKDIESWMAQL